MNRSQVWKWRKISLKSKFSQNIKHAETLSQKKNQSKKATEKSENPKIKLFFLEMKIVELFFQKYFFCSSYQVF